MVADATLVIRAGAPIYAGETGGVEMAGAHHKNLGFGRPAKRYVDPDDTAWSGDQGTAKYQPTDEAELYCGFPGCDMGPFRSAEALEWHRELRHGGGG